MSTEFDNFLKSYKESDKNIKDIIDSDEIGIFVENILKDTPYSGLKSKLIVITSNNLLNLISDIDLPDKLTKLAIDNKTTQVLSVKILNFVKSLTKNPDNTKTDFDQGAGKPFNTTNTPQP
ncbi:MAG: hypothetical protein R3B60_01215 [Candidatus Paceibacterota bacterium]